MKPFFLLLAAALSLGSCDILDPHEPGLLVPLTVDEDPTLPSIAVNGTKLHSETYGNPDDPMLVILHGGPGSDYRSMLNCSRFSNDGFFVVFFDQRGSGLSRRHDRSVFTKDMFVDDLRAVISYYRRGANQKVFLMGLSWGAMLATAYINDHPGEISGAVLMEPGGFTWHDTEEYIKRTRKLEVFQESTNDFVYLDQLFTASDHNELDYKAALQSAAGYAEGNRLGNAGPYPFWRIGAICNIASIEYVRDHPFDFTTQLSGFTTKVLFVYSEFNEAYGRTYAEHVSSAYPNVQLVEVAGTGHEIPYFGWNRFYPAAKSYLISLK